MPQRLTDTTPTCPKCAAIGPVQVDERTRVRVTELLSRDQVLEALGGKFPLTEFTHAIGAEGLRGRYKLSPGKVQCSFEGGIHPQHSEGYVVRTLCDELLNVGIDCARHWTPGVELVERAWGRTLKYDRNIFTIDNDPTELQVALTTVSRQLVALNEARQALTESLRHVARRMHDAADSLRFREVRITTFHRTEREESKAVESTYELRGWELWSNRPSVLPLEAQLTELQEDIRRERQADKDLNEEHERLARRLHKLRGEVHAIEEWIEHASSFFLEDNLHLVIGDTKQGHVAEVQGQSLIVRDDGKRLRIDVNGRTVLPS